MVCVDGRRESLGAVPLSCGAAIEEDCDCADTTAFADFNMNQRQPCSGRYTAQLELRKRCRAAAGGLTVIGAPPGKT